MNPQENKMETINLTDIFQPQLLAEAEATRVNAEQALHNVKTETTAERAMMVEQYNKLRAEMPALKQKLGPLQECIRVKARIDLDTASDKEELAKAETLVVKMEAEFNELSGKFRPQEERTKELIAAVPTAMPIVARFAALLQARHPGIRPAVLSMSSDELEQGLADLSIDLALGYTERMGLRDTRLVAWPQYTEHYFLLHRAVQTHPHGLQRGPAILQRVWKWHPLGGLRADAISPRMVRNCCRPAFSLGT